MTNSRGAAVPAPNRVELVGRIVRAPQVRVLPSGVEVVTFRLSVRRDRSAMTSGSRQLVDWVDCTAWTTRMRARVAGWKPGDQVRVAGAFRRRHLRDGGGSIVDIEIRDGARTGIGGGEAPHVDRASESAGAAPD